ncbi:hypothetical protein F0562_031940 [Nyssa sinensis]|uniref:tyrosine--tRNA ligase n=1 Tax=Nyssa sinensis TaxID=561372 RepID=A0A5J5AU58_9ASTE|nr:hypothetical protein F0562_031940 [Nyssa sinensis]
MISNGARSDRPDSSVKRNGVLSGHLITGSSFLFQFLKFHDPMSVEEKFEIVRSVGEECIQEDELMNLLTKKPLPICYDGFEPSGRMHIARGVMKIINVNKLTSAGCKVEIWIANWFAQLNNKMGGDLKKIQTVGRYMIEIWKAVGLKTEGGQVEFLWSSEEINSRAHEYWPLVMDIARKNELPRIPSVFKLWVAVNRMS